jgi:hypothetical protein
MYGPVYFFLYIVYSPRLFYSLRPLLHGECQLRQLQPRRQRLSLQEHRIRQQHHRLYREGV